MPEDAEREPLVSVLEALDDAVLGPRHLPKARPDAPVALVMVRLHGRPVAQQPAQTAVCGDLHVVIRERARIVPVLLVADGLREVLLEVAAPSHVQELRAAADGQNRHVPFERRLQKT